jgi:hypothetical protein
MYKLNISLNRSAWFVHIQVDIKFHLMSLNEQRKEDNSITGKELKLSSQFIESKGFNCKIKKYFHFNFNFFFHFFF